MARHGENIYHRKDGRYEGRYIKGYDENEKALIGYVYGKTYKEVKEKLTTAKANVTVMAKTLPSDILVSEWFDKWIHSLKRVKDSTYTTYLSNVNRHIKPYFKKKKLKMLTKDNTQDFVDYLSSKLAPKTVRSVFSVFRLGLIAAYEKKFIVPEIYSNIKLPKVVKKEVKVFTQAEQHAIEQFIETSDNPNDIGILICFYTGLRIGELCALDDVHLDLKRGVLSVRFTVYRVKNKGKGKKTVVVITTPKSPSSIRDIPLPKFLIDKLKNIPNGSGFIIQRNGNFIEPAVYARRYKRILEMLDIPYRKFHSTRHTFATRALEIGMDIKTLSELLGHSSPTVTLNLYAHSLPEHKKNEMERLGKLYNPSK